MGVAPLRKETIKKAAITPEKTRELQWIAAASLRFLTDQLEPGEILCAVVQTSHGRILTRIENTRDYKMITSGKNRVISCHAVIEKST